MSQARCRCCSKTVAQMTHNDSKRHQHKCPHGVWCAGGNGCWTPPCLLCKVSWPKYREDAALDEYNNSRGMIAAAKAD